MPDKRYSKVEEEIIQILDQMDREAPPERPSKPSNLVTFRPRPKPRRGLPNVQRFVPTRFQPLARVRRLSSGSWVGVGVVAAIVAWQLSRFSGILGTVAMVVSIFAFLAALYTRRSGGGKIPGLPPAAPTTKRWRGRDIEVGHTRRTSVADRTRKWSRKWRDPRR